MFINNLICNYNAKELLLVASRLIFSLNSWSAQILIMELTNVLLVEEKKSDRKDFNPLFWVCMITFPFV
jgi:hypothetical protein